MPKQPPKRDDPTSDPPPSGPPGPPDGKSAIVRGCQGFLDFSEPLHRIGFPWIIPLFHSGEECGEMSWGDVDRHPELRESELNLTARLDVHDAPIFNVGEMWARLKALASMKEDSEVIGAFTLILRDMAGEYYDYRLDAEIESVGGEAVFAERLRTLYPVVE